MKHPSRGLMNQKALTSHFRSKPAVATCNVGRMCDPDISDVGAKLEPRVVVRFGLRWLLESLTCMNWEADVVKVKTLA